MKFSKLVAILAIAALAANANAYNDGTLRRSATVAQADYDANREVNININTNANTASQAQAASAQQQVQQPVQQPITVVEASPVSDSRAEALRKARLGAEVQTEQKIVEKLEDSRLQEERARADRLFGNKLDSQPQVVLVPASVPQPPPPVQQAPPPASIVQEKNTQVTIEKVEIIQPKEERRHEPEARITAAREHEDERGPSTQKYYVSGLLGNMNYAAGNVKSNYAMGLAVGTIIDERIGIELSYLHSSHDVDTYWDDPIYRTLEQNDLTAAGKYYLLQGRLKPYVGASISYVMRKYQDRVYGYPYSNNSTNSVSTNSVDFGLLGGADFELTERFAVGLGADYNFNVMSTSQVRRSDYSYYGYKPDNTTPLEKLAYWTIKLNAKFMF